MKLTLTFFFRFLQWVVVQLTLMFLQTSAIKHYHLNFLNKLVLCQLWIEIVLCRIGMNIFPGTCTVGYTNHQTVITPMEEH